MARGSLHIATVGSVSTGVHCLAFMPVVAVVTIARVSGSLVRTVALGALPVIPGRSAAVSVVPVMGPLACAWAVAVRTHGMPVMTLGMTMVVTLVMAVMRLVFTGVRLAVCPLFGCRAFLLLSRFLLGVYTGS
ncbi:MAG: hypothetical protein KF690_00290 [Bacteroidetes bacterium]|nr:hypothetical protein [Bacteroidota bacterium]